MKRENDEITDLFRSRLTDVKMDVRDGFWEELSQDIPVACQHRRRMIFFRVAAAASVFLVLAASSATFWYLSPKEEMEHAFTQVITANGGFIEGDGVRVKPLPQASAPILQKMSSHPATYISQTIEEEEEDPATITFTMTFSFSTIAPQPNRNSMWVRGNNGLWQARGGTNSPNAGTTTDAPVATAQIENVKKRKWALKGQIGTALPADHNNFKMPISAAVTVERILNDYVGVETGVIYSNLRSKGQSLHYLGVPVKVNVTMMNTKKVDLYASVGGIADKCIAGAPNNSFKKEPIQLGVTAGVGVRYRCLPNRVSLITSIQTLSWLL